MAKIRLAAFCYMHLQGSRKRPNLCYTHQFATVPYLYQLTYCYMCAWGTASSGFQRLLLELLVRACKPPTCRLFH